MDQDKAAATAAVESSRAMLRITAVALPRLILQKASATGQFKKYNKKNFFANYVYFLFYMLTIYLFYGCLALFKCLIFFLTTLMLEFPIFSGLSEWNLLF